MLSKYLFKIYKKISYWYFLQKKSNLFTKSIFDKNLGSYKLDIFTIAFNNFQMIEKQILLINKYLSDQYKHVVADNSNDIEESKKIQEICLIHNIEYVKIPRIKLKPSHSHAAAMHWVFCRIISKRKSPYFGFIDHDIFPITKTSILDKMWNGIYGRVIPPYGSIEISNNQPYWSLWGGFFFFKYSIFDNISFYEFDFFPKVISENLILDTGGGLWDRILSKFPIPPQLVQYFEVKIDPDHYKNIQSDAYEKIDDWVHFVNLSNW